MRRPGCEEWKKLIAEFQQSGMSQKEFIAKHDVNLSTFQYWLYKRSKLNSKFDVNSSPRFLPVEVVGLPASSTRVEAAGIEAPLPKGGLRRFSLGRDPPSH